MSAADLVNLDNRSNLRKIHALDDRVLCAEYNPPEGEPPQFLRSEHLFYVRTGWAPVGRERGVGTVWYVS